MEYAACMLPAVPVRKKSSHKAELTNQLLFGDVMEIVKEKKNWWKIKTLHDGYEGWVRNNAVVKTNSPAMQQTSQLAAGIFNTIKINDSYMQIPFGSSLHGLHNKEGVWNNKNYHFSGNICNTDLVLRNTTTINYFSKLWLNAPYLWGGRTIMGVDCSGYSQLIYKMLGISLKRDAWQQAEEGVLIKKNNDVICGDLAFFQNKKGKIVHVGILLDTDTIIHASGKVRIDKMDEKGIINGDTGLYSHQLHSIKRFW